ncbi:MAG TPA: metallophosphoesterase [Terriglobales bacterium]|nr:metallophosphoesterase [Terriglobales bacterium]
MRRLFLVIAFIGILLPATAESQQPWFFAVLSDPQMGMYAKDKNFAQETANFEFAIANLNRLHPRFVVICGDLVNRSGDAAEIAEYKRILHELDPSIPAYYVAGNHDVGNVPTSASLAGFRASLGPDYYTFSANGILGVVLDSNLIRSPQRDTKAAEQQEEWLRKTLASARSNPNEQVVVFQHIPYFIHDPNEAEDYFNIPMPARRKYLDLLENAGVKYVFAGHLHRNVVGKDGPLTETVTGAVGMPLGHSLSGFRIVTVKGQTLESRWYCFGGIPNQIDPQNLAAIPCPQ